MRVLVCGGRDYTDRDCVFAVLTKLHLEQGISVVIHGTARGADALAARWAAETGVSCEEYPPDWDRDGRAAGPIRNATMLKNGKPNMVVAFPGGRGTADMVRIAERAGVNVVKVQPSPDGTHA